MLRCKGYTTTRPTESELRGRVEELEDCLQKIVNWCDAYPLDIFPEPDFEAVKFALASKGIKLDAVSASNMRHVVNGVKKQITTTLEGK
jgi:hypothetical protein